MNVAGYSIAVVSTVFEVYIWLIVARVLLSYVRVRHYNPILRFIYEATEPVLGFIRRLLPPTGAIDFSPIVAFLFLEVAKMLLIGLLTSMFAVHR
jgi:YggT family protein